MKGTVVDRIKYPEHRGGGYGYIIRTDEGKLELWPEEALEPDMGKMREQDEDEEEEEEEE